MKYKIDWMHIPQPAIPPCPYQKGMTPPHNGKPADPEFRYYYLVFNTQEEAIQLIEQLKLKERSPDYRMYRVI